MNFIRKRAYRKSEGFICREIKGLVPNKRYSRIDEEEISEVLDENKDRNNQVDDMKTWIIQQVKLGDYEAVFNRLFCLDNQKKIEFFEDLDLFVKTGQDFEEVLSVIKKYEAFTGNPVFEKNTLSNPTVLEQNDSKFMKKTPSGELKKIMKNHEVKLCPISREKHSSASVCPMVSEIFQFFAESYNKKKRVAIAERKDSNCISFEFFERFVKCFKLDTFPQLNKETLVSIFKKNSIYHKVMKLGNFTESLFDISKIVFPGMRLEKFYDFLGLENGSYKSKLIEKHDSSFLRLRNLDESMKKVPPRKCGTTKNHLRLEKIAVVRMPKSSLNQARTPITWKDLNNMDLSDLGDEYDVRKEIFETTQSKKGYSMY